MATQVLVTVMGEAIGEARLATWLKQVGEPVRRGDELAELETDKAVLMLECPADGVLLEIVVEAGVMVTTGQLLAQVGRPGEATAGLRAAAASPARVAADPVPPPQGDALLASDEAWDRLRISPAARRMLRGRDVDLAALSAAKPGARITTEDVARWLAANAAQPGGNDRLPQRRILLSETQRVMALRMAQSAREIPQFAVTMEADATRLLQVKQDLASAEGAPSLTMLLVYLAARVLQQHPSLNARYDDDAVILFETVNMGVAVNSPQGLVVPVIRGAERLGLVDLARRFDELIERARSGRLSLEQVSSGTFTLSNLGMYGVSQFVPLVNPPQAAILGVGGIQPLLVPVATGTQLIQRILLTVSADHRVVDGVAVAAFLNDLRRALEAPDIR